MAINVDGAILKIDGMTAAPPGNPGEIGGATHVAQALQFQRTAPFATGEFQRIRGTLHILIMVT